MNKEELEKLNVDVVSIRGEKGSLKDDAAKLPLDLSIEEVMSLNELFLSRDEFYIDTIDNNNSEFMAMLFARGVLDNSGNCTILLFYLW